MDSPDNGSVDAGASLSASLSVSSSSSLADRYILTHVGQQQLLFPSEWVAEILLVDRSQILGLPFYDPSFLGIVHYHGQMIVLVAIGQILAEATALMREPLSVVQLSAAADRLAGVGIVVDRASDHQLCDQLPTALFDPDLATAALQRESLYQPVQIFHPGLLPDRLWQPQRWRQVDNL